MDTRANSPEPNIIGIDKPNTSSAPTAILWITFVIALGFTVFLFMASRSTHNALVAKEAQKTEIQDQLSSTAYTEVATKASSFKDAFDVLNKLTLEKQPKKEIFDELYKHFTNDVIVKNLSWSSEGFLGIDAATSSYRSAADFMTALKNYKRISEVKLTSASLDSGDGVAENQKVVFSITAKLDTAKEKPVVADSSTSSGNSTATPDNTETLDTSLDTTSSNTTSDTVSDVSGYDTEQLTPADASTPAGL